MLVCEAFVTWFNGRSMTDHTLGLPAGRPRTARLRSSAAQLLRRIQLRPTTSWAVSGARLGMTAAAWLACRADSTRVSRRWAALALPLFAALAWYGADAKGERRHMQFYYENLYVSSFYASWGETLETLWRGALLEAAPRAAAAAPAFSIPASCDAGAKPPHIILIHEESVVQPSLFPTLRYDHSVDPFFNSYDDRLHRLRVETYG